MTLQEQKAAISDEVDRLIRETHSRIYYRLKKELEVTEYDERLDAQARSLATDFVFEQTEIGRKYVRLDDQMTACAGGGVVDVQKHFWCGQDMGVPLEVKVYRDGSEVSYDPSMVVKE